MRRSIEVLAGLILAMLASAAYAEMNIEDLAQALKSGDVDLVQVTGDGGSSGAVLEGYLLNNRSVSKNIHVQLGTPIYFSNNSDLGQNMIATQIYQRDLSYWSNGGYSFISLKANERLAIVLIAYCVDFDKDNPSRSDSFRIEELPPDAKDVKDAARKILAYERANPDKDVTIAAQLALWVAQGENCDSIRERFPFDAADERQMRAILKTNQSCY